MGMFSPIKMGSWWTRSEMDPRFNMDGRDYVGGMVTPPAAKEAILAKERELGVPAPDDLTCEYMKD